MAEVRHGGEYVRHVVLPTLRVALECLTDGCWRWGKRLAGYWKIGAIRLFGRRVTGSRPAATYGGWASAHPRRQRRGRHPSARRTVLFFRSQLDRKSTRLNSSHLGISYAVFCLKKKK